MKAPVVFPFFIHEIFQSAINPVAQTRVIHVGTDEVHIGPASATVFSSFPNPDWEAREFCSMAVYIEGTRYRVLQRRHVDGGSWKWEYELGLWTDSTAPTHFIEFNESFVLARNREQKRDNLAGITHLLIKPFYPFLGFAWSGFKKRVLEDLGFNAHSITSASVMIEFALFLLESIFVFWLNAGYIALVCSVSTLTFDQLLLAFLAIDLVIRGNQVMRGDECPDGFLEWINPMSWVKRP